MKKSVLNKLGAYSSLFLIALLLAFNYHLFIVKNDFAPAGLNGIATMIQYKTGFSIGYMSLIINVPLCLLAYFFVNRRFALRSLFFCLVYSFSYLGLQKLGLSSFQYDAQGHDTIFPVILSGVLSGFVYGVCFHFEASTGGTDILSKYISKIKPQWNFFYVTFVLNAIVAISSFFVYAQPTVSGGTLYDYKPACLCVIYCFISTFLGNYIISGTKKACKFIVITNHPDEITQDIFKELKHSATRIEALGSYQKTSKTVLICVMNRHQIVTFKNILKRYDNTFSCCETVNETYGNFKHVK